VFSIDTAINDFGWPWTAITRSITIRHISELITENWETIDIYCQRQNVALCTLVSVTTLSFDAPSPGNPREYPHKPYIARNYSHCGMRYIFAADHVGVPSYKFSWWVPKDVCVLKQSTYVGPSKSSKFVDFGTNRKRVCDFLLVINSNLGPIQPRFRDIAGFLLRRATPPLFHPNFRGVAPVACWCCGSEERRPHTSWTASRHALLSPVKASQ